MLTAKNLIEKVLKGSSPAELIQEVKQFGQDNESAIRAVLSKAVGKSKVNKKEVYVSTVRGTNKVRVYAFEKPDIDKAHKALNKAKWPTTLVKVSPNEMYYLDITVDVK